MLLVWQDLDSKALFSEVSAPLVQFSNLQLPCEIGSCRDANTSLQILLEKEWTVSPVLFKSWRRSMDNHSL